MNEDMMMNGQMGGMMICAIITTVVVITILILLIVQTVYQVKILREVRQISSRQRHTTHPTTGHTGEAP